jgi:hypothetical protein
MTELEQQLAKALARREAPVGFADRVLAAVQEPDRAVPWWRRVLVRPPEFAWRLVPATVALVIAMSGALYQHHERAEQGEAAKRQLVTALKIAGEKLHSAQQRVVDISEIRMDEASY